MKIIDSSARMAPNANPCQIEAFLAEMQKSGIQKAVICSDDNFVCVNNESGNSLIKDITNRYPSNLAWIACANPWLKDKATAILENCFRDTCKGLYLHPGRQGFHVSEKIVYPLIEVCEKYARPVFIHTGTPIFSMPFQVAALARDFPRVHFIMGHAAWSDFSGYDLIPSAKSCENIYIETSCTVTPIIRTALDILGPGKIIFGSGFPRSNMTVEIAKIKRMSLSSEEREAIFYKNANSHLENKVTT